MVSNEISIKVSVIVPIYKVEKFISRCVLSLMNQTLEEVEFIFVNDATPDNSMRLLKEIIVLYPNRKAQVHLIDHIENCGLSAARNTGLRLANGEYIFHCDSDDFLDSDALEQMYRAAKENEADIVWTDWYLSFKKNERYMKQPCYATPIEALKGMLSGSMKYNVWNKLIKRELYISNEIFFPDGYGMGEDMTIIRLFSCAKKVSYIPKAFYHYVKLNNGAFSQTYSECHLLELKHNAQETLAYLKNKYGNRLEEEYEFFKLDIKYPFLITDKWSKYKLWQIWYPEANRYVSMNRNVSARRRIIQLLANKRQYWLVFLYYKLVNKFMYGIIYR